MWTTLKGMLPSLKETLLRDGMLWQSIKQNYVFYVSIVVCSWVIARFSGKSFVFALLTFLYASFVGYAGHATVHYINFSEAYAQCTHPILKNPVASPIFRTACKYLDFHDITHHDTDVNRKIQNVLLEFSLNFINQGGLLMLLVYICRYVNLYVVFLWSFAYCTVHNINYDYLAPVAHKLHHKDKTTNYGIDVWDILFGTKHPGDAIENINHYAINLGIITVLISLYLID